MSNGSDFFLGGPLDLQEGPSDYRQPTPPKRRRFTIRSILLALLACAAIAGLGFVIWRFLGQKADAPIQSNNGEVEQNPINNDTADQSKNGIPEPGELKTFKSDFPRLEFNYPASWVVTADKEQRGIRIESPQFSYETVENGLVDGNFRIYIRQGARAADSKYIGRGVAALPSEKLTYGQPVPDQRTETNLSFFGLDSPDHFAYMFIAGNYSLKVGDSLGPDFGKEPQTFIIAGGYSAKTLTDDLATHKVPLSSFQQSNAYRQAQDIIKSLKLL